MINMNWDKLLLAAHDSAQLYGHAYGALDIMIKQCHEGRFDIEELDVQRRILEKQVEARFNELMAESKAATERWLARSLENLHGKPSTPSAAIYEEGAAIGDQEVPE